MINIYNKTDDQVTDEILEVHTSETLTMTAIVQSKICMTYLVIDGENVDTDDLTEDQIIDLFHNDLEDYFSSPKNGTYKNGRPAHKNLENLENLIKIGRHNPDSFILAELLAKRKFSYEAIIDLVNLRYSNGDVGAIIVDTLEGPSNVIIQAQLLAREYQRTQRDLSSFEKTVQKDNIGFEEILEDSDSITPELIICMIDEMRTRDLEKKQQSRLSFYNKRFHDNN